MSKAWLFSGRAHVSLARDIAALAGIALGQVEITHFPDGELSVQVKEDVQHDYVFVLQPLCSSEAILELLLLVDGLKRCKPGRLVLLVPYFGYGRQDRRTGQSPVSAEVIAGLLNRSGADALITLELHTPRISHFITLQHLHLRTSSLFADYMWRQVPENKELVVVSPDRGGRDRARRLNQTLGTGRPVTVLEKKRLAPDSCQVVEWGSSVDVAGQQAVLVDDIVSTGATLIQAARFLAEQGADPIWACVAHLVASPKELGRRIAESPIERLLVTNSLPHPEPQTGSKITVVSLAPLLASAVLQFSQPSWQWMWAQSMQQPLARAEVWAPQSLSAYVMGQSGGREVCGLLVDNAERRNITIIKDITPKSKEPGDRD